MLKKRKIRLRDIADQADVSVTTVSLVLNNKALAGNVRISEKTVQRVRGIALEMGYLSRGIVGMIVPAIGTYFLPMIYGVMEVLQEAKYSLGMTMPTDWNLQREIDEVRLMADKGFDGLIMGATPQFVAYSEEFPHLFQHRNRVVMMNWATHLDIPYATINHEQCGYLAAKHLLDLGHRRVVFIGEHYPSENHRTSMHIVDDRFLGYHRAMTEYDLPCVSVEKIEDLFGLQEKATAVYCSRTTDGLDLLSACWDRGIRVPDDLCVVGQDDDRERSAVRPQMTAVDMRPNAVGNRAARMVLDLIDGKTPRSTVLNPRLIVRQSTRSLAS